jgi:hypothetical protein
VVFAPGLTDPEIQRAEQSYELVFPPDLREFLMVGLPVSDGWVNWREIDSHKIRERLNWPWEGICFDIEHNVFWPREWGPTPLSLPEAFAYAKQKVDAAPKLIPIYSHRYLPNRPLTAGNPVFSLYQTDIIYYGANLWDYLESEFHFESPTHRLREPIRQIEFWSWLIEREC